MKIGIINDGIGNIGSVMSALKFYKTYFERKYQDSYEVQVVNDILGVEDSDILILAGVGNFKTAVKRINEMGIWTAIDDHVIRYKKPIIGICLGMQLFADYSKEGGITQGFGWIEGSVEKIKSEKLPHIGWNFFKSSSNLFNNTNSFYYMHSYHFIPDYDDVIIATTEYEGQEIVAAVRKDNVIGVQFHPEKSQSDGLKLLRNILEDFK